MRRPILLLSSLLRLDCVAVTPNEGRDSAVPRDGTVRDGTADAGGCARATYAAVQKPAALLVVLDRSESMAQNSKYVYAAQAIVQALDQDVFDTMYLGLYASPTGTVTGPACIFGMAVACQTPPFPQVDLVLAGDLKSSDPTGVRRSIKDWLAANGPMSGMGDASPLFAALQAALGAIRAWSLDGTRILVVVTDGTLSCNQFSSRAGFPDCNGCDHDWEHPQNLATLLGDAYHDVSQPVSSFIVGVPGADSYDQTGCSFPPYRMRHALSAIAYAGAPEFVSPTCDGTAFAADGPDPTESCHFDMTQGGYSASALADTIAYIRGQALGCVFELPEPPVGETIELDEVNVSYVVDGSEVSLARRQSPDNPCTDVGCWDYTDDQQVELVGAACADVKAAQSVSVSVVVGCQTIVL